MLSWGLGGKGRRESRDGTEPNRHGGSGLQRSLTHSLIHAFIHSPAACFARMMAAASSLAFCCWVPLALFLGFYIGRQTWEEETAWWVVGFFRGKGRDETTYDSSRGFLGLFTGFVALVSSGHFSGGFLFGGGVCWKFGFLREKKFRDFGRGRVAATVRCGGFERVSCS
jgi:hypothetical protein